MAKGIIIGNIKIENRFSCNNMLEALNSIAIKVTMYDILKF